MNWNDPDQVRAYNRAWASRNKQRLQKYRASYYQANRERLAANHRQYRQVNRDRIRVYYRAYRASYYQANKERIAAYHRQYRQINRARVNARQRLWSQQKPERAGAIKRRHRDRLTDGYINGILARGLKFPVPKPLIELHRKLITYKRLCKTISQPKI